MTSKKSNFLPLLLIGGGVAGAALLYGFGTKQSKEDNYLGGGFGIGGSRDFLGSSGISKGYDSTDLGVEDYAFNRASPDAFALPSDGAANPEKVVDESGAWTFADTAVLGLTAAAAAPAVVKGAKSVGSKVASSSVGQAVKSVSGSSVRSVATSALKKLGIVGGIATVIDALVGTASAPTPEFDTSAIYTTSQNISTDLAAKVGIGNMTTPKQEAHAEGLSGGKYPITMATPEEAALVNKAAGLESGDVLKVTGNKFTSYIPEEGMQVTFSSGGTLEGTVTSIMRNKAKKGA